jgi:hypothetical protein
MFMGISLPAESNPSRLRPHAQRGGRRPQVSWPFHKILYRGLVVIAGLAVMGSIAVLSLAQEAPPEIIPLKKELRRKKDLGPRALGLLKMTPSGKATLVPIMIEIDGKFYDASAYKADPVPMALDAGTVYEGEKTGVSLGLFTISNALHSLAANADVPWIATGAWLAAGSQAPKTAMKAEAVPVGLENTDAPPRLSKGGTSSSTTTPPPSATTAPASPSATPSSTASASPSNPSSSGSSPAAAPPAPASSPAASPANTSKPEQKNDQKETEQKPSSQSDVAPPRLESKQSLDDTNRPRLRRGKPVGPMPDYDVPGYGKPRSAKDSAPNSGSDSAAKPAAIAAPIEPVELVAAISDANGPELRSYAYEWDKTAEDERRTQMESLAKEQVRAYIEARAKGQIPAKPAPRATARKPITKVAEPVLENVQMHTFDLWGSNQPVLVLSAEAHLPPAASAKTIDVASAPLQYKIMLVARTDIYGKLRKLYSGVTDRFHLDVTPELDLIDAVDADGDGRGELLFRKTTDTGSGYAIYRATADSLWKMFDSVNPE